MADPTNFTIEEKATGFLFAGDLGMGRKEYLAKFSDYMPIRMGIGTADEYVYMKPLNGAVELGRLYPANILSSPPFGSAEDLFTWLTGFFVSASSTTYAVLLADLQNGLGPVGQWVFVSDVFTEIGAGWYGLCTSPTTMAQDGFGIGLRCDWRSQSTYPATVGGYPCSGSNLGQWRPEACSFRISGAVTLGTFEPGEPVSSATWNGILCYDDGGTLVAYTLSTSATAQPSPAEVITGADSGATFLQSGVAGDNQFVGGGMVCAMDFAIGGIYKHFIRNGGQILYGDLSPDVSSAWVAIERTDPDGGYIAEAWAVRYDIMGYDDTFKQGWVAGIDDGHNKWFLSEADSRNVFLSGTSKIITFPWGAQSATPGTPEYNISGLDIRGNFTPENCGDLVLKGIDVGTRTAFSPVLGRKSSMVGITLEAGATLAASLPGQTDDSVPNNGITISNVTVKAGKTLSGKTFTRSVGDMVVTDDETAPESLGYAPFTETGLRRFAKVFTAAELTSTPFDVTPGLLFFTPPAGTFPVGTIFLQKKHDTAAFGMSVDLATRMGNGGSGNITGRYSNGLLTAASNQRLSLPFPQLTSGASSKAMESAWGAAIYLSSFGGSTLATAGGNSTLTVILEYKLDRPLVV